VCNGPVVGVSTSMVRCEGETGFCLCLCGWFNKTEGPQAPMVK
jgi:hypothetical protein